MKSFLQLSRLNIASGTAALALFLIATGPAAAGQITATLKADPSTINEGGWTTLTLSVHDQPNTGSVSYFDNGYYASNYWWTGSGSLDSVGASINSGDGQSKAITNGSITGTDYKGSVAMQYSKPGDYMATVSGTAGTRDREAGWWGHYYWVWQGWWWGWQRYFVTDGSGSWDVGSYSNITASTQIHVDNVAPTITEIDWAPIVQTGEVFNFSVTASDPGLGGGEQLTYAFDFSGSGLYNDLVLTGGRDGVGELPV
jgi:hypothetical protein